MDTYMWYNFKNMDLREQVDYNAYLWGQREIESREMVAG